MSSRTSPRSFIRHAAVGLGLFSLLASASGPAMAAPEAGVHTGPLTNLAHLDSLLADVPLLDVPGHSTYQQATEPTAIVPWTYADNLPGGGFRNVGGGNLDAVTGHWSQGAYNTDDITRTAVVYLRHLNLTGNMESSRKAKSLLRSVMYMQTTEGPNAGNSVLWQQPDGQLNPSAEPVELPDPSDSGESYWVARTLWALGEGYATYKDSDPAFAAFIKDRLHLSLQALNRESLSHYGEWSQADGVSVPAWLIADGADSTAEAVLGLSAYVQADPADIEARTALEQYAEGIAAMGSGNLGGVSPAQWPFGAIIPWTLSQSMWHAWGGQPPAALAAAGKALNDPTLFKPAVADTVQFTGQLLATGGIDNAWGPGFTEPAQIAYGVDSRIQSLLGVADATGATGLTETAALAASWYFGANRGGQPMYDPATGVTFDGLELSGNPNRNSGAESTIHGLLSMIALDAHPEVRAAALSMPTAVSHTGLSTVEGESATGGTVVTPASGWTGESSISQGKYLLLADGETAMITIPASDQPQRLLPIINRAEAESGTSLWSAGSLALGTLPNGGVGAPGITEASGQLKPLALGSLIPAGTASVSVTARGGDALIDAVLIQPLIASAELTDGTTRTVFRWSSAGDTQALSLGNFTERNATAYDASGHAAATQAVTGIGQSIPVAPGGFVVERSSLVPLSPVIPDPKPADPAQPLAEAGQAAVPTGNLANTGGTSDTPGLLAAAVLLAGASLIGLRRLRVPAYETRRN